MKISSLFTYLFLMAQPIISVRGLSKRYRLGETLSHDTLRDHLMHGLRSLSGRFRAGDATTNAGGAAHTPQEFWALRDVSFDVLPGEVVGVIGRNGAGKSTLLKVLSQITEPTEGEIIMHGRLASLLEVGTGFHPELSGRENIFLNGAILGMRKAEIKRKFDEIVAFAEVEQFLDTPVKRYSSGMYVRLAFSVAAHLEPEILVVDEVLAVGDAAFQAKCLGKMEDVARNQGRTVLFVSHNMSAVQSLCGTILHLKGGRVFGFGQAEEQIQTYIAELKKGEASDSQSVARLGASLELHEMIFNPNPIMNGEPLDFTLKIMPTRDTRVGDVHLLIYSTLGTRVAIVDLRQKNGEHYSLTKGTPLTLKGRISRLPLVEGDYKVGVCVACSEYHADFHDLRALSVCGRAATSANIPHRANYRGLVELESNFQSE